MMTLNKLPAFLKSLKAMSSKGVLVGIPHDKDSRSDGSETNAQIAFTQEFGSGVKNIPPRPFLIPAIKKIQPKAIEILKDGAIKAMHGEDIHITYEKVGLIGQNAVQNEIKNGSFVPLAESTLRARRNRRKNGKAGTKPLIDTGQMLNSITYVVRDA